MFFLEKPKKTFYSLCSTEETQNFDFAFLLSITKHKSFEVFNILSKKNQAA